MREIFENPRVPSSVIVYQNTRSFSRSRARVPPPNIQIKRANAIGVQKYFEF